MKNNSLASLVDRAARNDEGAFEELYKQYYKSVYYAAIKLCKSEADAEDIAQITFIKVRKSIHTLQQPDYFPLWLNRVCINVAKNFFRKNKDVTFSDEYFLLHNKAIETRTDHVTQKYWHKQNDVEVLAKFIDEMKPEHKEILTLFYFQHKSYECIAKQLHMPEGTVKSRLYYARNELKKKIEGYESREDLKLDFQGETIGAAIVSLCLAKQASMIPKLGCFDFYQRFAKRIPKSVTTKVMLATSLCAANVVAIGYANQVYEQVHEQVYEPKESYNDFVETIKNSTFDSIMIGDYTIVNEVDAYYLLMNWGFNQQALDKKSKEELLEIKPLYDEIKKQNGQLIKVLNESNWSSYYEQLMRK